MEKIVLSSSLLTFILADCGDKAAAHAVRLDVVREHVVSAVKGNASQLIAAAKEVSARKEKTAKAYAAAFQAAGIPEREKYTGKCTADIMEKQVLPRVATYMATWEKAFLEVMPLEAPVLTEAEQKAADAKRAADKAAKLDKAATEAGYVKPEKLSREQALPIILGALSLLEVSELTRVMAMCESLQEEKFAAAQAREPIAA